MAIKLNSIRQGFGQPRLAVLCRTGNRAGSACTREDECPVVDRPLADRGSDHALLLQLRQSETQSEESFYLQDLS